MNIYIYITSALLIAAGLTLILQSFPRKDPTPDMQPVVDQQFALIEDQKATIERITGTMEGATETIIRYRELELYGNQMIRDLTRERDEALAKVKELQTELDMIKTSL